MPITTSFRELDVWQESMLLVEDYRITRKFPREERYGLTSQLRDAAVSIPSNIGEGARRKRKLAPPVSSLKCSRESIGSVDAEPIDCFATTRRPLLGAVAHHHIH